VLAGMRVEGWARSGWRRADAPGDPWPARRRCCVLAVFQAHSGAINALALGEGVAVTAGDDRWGLTIPLAPGLLPLPRLCQSADRTA
jgi:hypothetical protein